jgi:hypothetical protein
MIEDTELRELLRRTAEKASLPPVMPAPMRRRIQVHKALVAGSVAAVVVVIAVAGAFIRSAIWTDAAPVPPADREEQEVERPAHRWQVAVIRDVINAINTRDTDAFIGAFTPRGDFNPRGDFDSQSGMFGMTLPVAQAQLVQAWMDIVEAWGLEADLGGCARLAEAEFSHRYRLVSGSSDAFAACDVTTRWHTLSMEIVERWTFEFEGKNVVAWEHWLLDLNPTANALPLDYDGLLAWEAWLKANHPDDAARYLNPRKPGPPGDALRSGAAGKLLRGTERSWGINGHEFSPNAFLPYDPAFADEIEASIQEYLDSR